MYFLRGNMSNIFWIGSRESDISQEKMFYGSITRYGTNTNNNMAFCNNDYTDSYETFLKSSLSYVLEKYPNCNFVFGNSLYAYKFDENIFNSTLCLNKLTALDSLNNKIFFRQLISDVVKVPQSIVLDLQYDTDFQFINSIFNNNYSRYVIQSAHSGGGEETFLLTPSVNINDFTGSLQQMLITPYLQNSIPVNVHIVLSETDYRIFPPSIQLISDLFHYTGSDFIKFKNLDESIKEKIILQCSCVAKKIQSLGAKGLLGVDLLIYNKELYFIECNLRYQGSSFLLNKTLLENGMPSIFKIHYQAFYENLNNLPIDVFNLDVNYSSFRRTFKNRTTALPTPIETKNDGNFNEPLRNGYIQYEVFNKSIFEFLK